jgi:hypothetical protein
MAAKQGPNILLLVSHRIRHIPFISVTTGPSSGAHSDCATCALPSIQMRITALLASFMEDASRPAAQPLFHSASLMSAPSVSSPSASFLAFAATFCSLSSRSHLSTKGQQGVEHLRAVGTSQRDWLSHPSCAEEGHGKHSPGPIALQGSLSWFCLLESRLMAYTRRHPRLARADAPQSRLQPPGTQALENRQFKDHGSALRAASGAAAHHSLKPKKAKRPSAKTGRTS